ncbi:hypothetical protein ACIPVK_09475 [Paeniglutamicibacter sp. MACA_103]|uniref:hypothetical protein n=1 Tax=Paeniglutamicibacter sp. MACA_103 TaxID=3377337 RepID=UPI0038930BD7
MKNKNGSSEDSTQGAQKKVNKIGRAIHALLMYSALILMISFFLISVYGFFSMGYDKDRVRPIECTVVSAEGGVVRGGPRGGTGSWAVSVITEECGSLRMYWHVTGDNAEDISAKLTPGEKYTFEIGEIEYKFNEIYKNLNISSIVYSFEKVE